MQRDPTFESLIHQRLLSGDPTAPSDLVIAILPQLVRQLKSKNMGVKDAALINDSAVDALLNYAMNPASFDPTRSSLSSYLFMSAQSDLKTYLRRTHLRHYRETPTDFVEEREDHQNDMKGGVQIPLPRGDDPSPLQIVEGKDLESWVQAEIDNPVDQKLVKLIFDGERLTLAYAEVLGVTHEPLRNQRRIVKRHKDRLEKKLRRLGKKLRG